jgi:transposase
MLKTSVDLTSEERDELEARTRSRSCRADDAKRARLILMLAAGTPYRTIQTSLPCNTHYIARWKARFLAERLAGLFSRHAGSKAKRRTTEMEARILNWTRRPPTDGSTHWSTRKLARHLGVDHMLVARVWARAGLQPHRMERYMASNDPDFEIKAADILGLYLKPPQHAAVFCVDEKTAIQALDRLDPVLPFSPGRVERHGFEYYRHGTLSLYAALNTKTGEVVGKTATRHTSAEFVAFLSDLVARQPTDREIHVIIDNLSAHKTQRVRDFLAEHPNVHLHYTPTYSSWLNQVELWFSKIERDVIARGVFTSVKDLAKKLMRYIRLYNQAPKPMKWTYRDPAHRISKDAAALSAVTGH